MVQCSAGDLMCARVCSTHGIVPSTAARTEWCAICWKCRIAPWRLSTESIGNPADKLPRAFAFVMALNQSADCPVPTPSCGRLQCRLLPGTYV